MGSYSTLLTDIPAFMENDSTELANNLPTIIQNTQDRMMRDLTVAELFGTYSGSLTASSISFPRPTDILTLRGVTILTTSGLVSLNYRDRGWMEQFWPAQGQTAVPIYYGVLNENTFMVAPTPNSGWFYTTQYKKRLAYLTASNTTNYLTDNCYDTLLAGCIEEAAKFVIDDRAAGLTALWGPRYKEGIATINAQQGSYAKDDFNTAAKG